MYGKATENSSCGSESWVGRGLRESPGQVEGTVLASLVETQLWCQTKPSHMGGGGLNKEICVLPTHCLKPNSPSSPHTAARQFSPPSLHMFLKPFMLLCSSGGTQSELVHQRLSPCAGLLSGPPGAQPPLSHSAAISTGFQARCYGAFCPRQ